MKKDDYYFPNRVIKQMNLPFTIKLATKDPDEIVMQELTTVTKKISNRLQRIDLDFSPFREDSLVRRYQRGDQDPILNSKDFQSVYAQSFLAEQMTDSIFTPYFSGKFDPTGLVKGWAIELCFDEYLKPLLDDPKIEAVSLNGGGDMKLATSATSNFQWGIGVENPQNISEIVAVYYLKNGAIATSGTNKRGEHIVKMGTDDILQSTIVSNSLVDADIWATVGVAAGLKKFESQIKRNQLSGLLIDKDQNFLNFTKGVIANAEKTPL